MQKISKEQNLYVEDLELSSNRNSGATWTKSNRCWLDETFIEFPLGEKKDRRYRESVFHACGCSQTSDLFVPGDNIKTSSGFLFLRRRTLITSMRDAPEGVSGFCVISVQGW